MKTPQLPDKLHSADENLSRRGRKTRTAATAAEVNFCAYFVLTGNVKQASLQAGYSAWWGYELLKMPRIQPILRDFEKRKQEEAWETAKGQIVLTREFLDELFADPRFPRTCIDDRQEKDEHPKGKQSIRQP